MGMVELFTAISEPTTSAVNANTSSAAVLDLIPGIGEIEAQDIVSYRQVEEGEGRVAFTSPAAIMNVPSLGMAQPQDITSRFMVRSSTFRVTVTVEVGGHTVRWVGIIRRSSPKETEILSLYRD